MGTTCTLRGVLHGRREEVDGAAALSYDAAGAAAGAGGGASRVRLMSGALGLRTALA